MSNDPRPTALCLAGISREDGAPELHPLPDADHGTCYAPAPLGTGHCNLDDDHDPRVDPHVCWGETADGVRYMLEWREPEPDEHEQREHDKHEQQHAAEDMPWPEVRRPLSRTDTEDGDR